MPVVLATGSRRTSRTTAAAAAIATTIVVWRARATARWTVAGVVAASRVAGLRRWW